MFHLAAFYESISASTLTALNAVTDNVLLIQQDQFVFQVDYNLLWASAYGTDLQRARINTATFRHVTFPHIRPFIDQASRNQQAVLADYSGNPLRLKRLENTAIEAFQDNVGAQVCAGLLAITDKPTMTPPQGDIYTMRATSTTAATAGSWVQLAMTFPDNLPDGTYALIGMMHVSATGIACRAIFENQVPRPGCVSLQDENEKGPELLRMGKLGVWGPFTSNRMPNFEVLCGAADSSHTIYFDFVRTL